MVVRENFVFCGEADGSSGGGRGQIGQGWIWKTDSVGGYCSKNNLRDGD